MRVSPEVDAIRIDEDGVVAFTQALVRIPSVNDPGSGRSEQPAADLVAAKMREFGWSRSSPRPPRSTQRGRRGRRRRR